MMGKKADATRSRIIESATYCLLHFGDRKATFQTIASHCGVSVGLVVKYLENRENIFPVVLDHWITWARHRTESTLAKSGSPSDRLRDYIRVSLDLFKSSDFARVYLLLHYFAGVDEKYRVLNTQIKDVAVERVSSILQDGITDQSFRDVDVPLTAKTIHNNLVGCVLSAMTETQKPFHLGLSRALEDSCLALVLARPEIQKI